VPVVGDPWLDYASFPSPSWKEERSEITVGHDGERNEATMIRHDEKKSCFSMSKVIALLGRKTL
jgi:hypothetical protein